MDAIQKANELVDYYNGNKTAIMDDIKVSLDHYSKMTSKFPTSKPVKDGMKYWMDVKKQVLNY
jgi:hypothetical protein